MNLCSDKHAEVCYEGRSCPACDELEAKQSIMEDLAQHKVALRQALDENDALTSEIHELTKDPLVNSVREARQA